MRYRPIRRNSEFTRCYARGKIYVHPLVVLYVLKTRSKNTRVGLTATKKVGHAVQRNRARRVMRAAIAEHLEQNIGGYDLVFVARAQTARVKSTQVSRAVAKLLAQAGLPDKARAAQNAAQAAGAAHSGPGEPQAIKDPAGANAPHSGPAGGGAE